MQRPVWYPILIKPAFQRYEKETGSFISDEVITKQKGETNPIVLKVPFPSSRAY